MHLINAVRSKALKVLIPCALCVALAVAVSACGGSSSSSSAGTTSGGESTTAGSGGGESTTAAAGSSLSGKKIFVLTCSNASPYCARFGSLLTEKFSAEGASVTVLNDEVVAAEEAAHLNQAISQQADLIIYAANAQEAARAPLLKAKQDGIPVILAGTAPAPNIEGLFTTYSGPNDVKSGELQAEMLNEGLEKAGVKSGKIMLLVGVGGSEPVEERLEGWNKAIATMPQWEVVAEPEGDWDPVKAAQVTAPIFAKYGSELVGVSAMSGPMGAGAAQAAQQAGLKTGTQKGEMVIAGINCDSSSWEAIKKGTMYATTSQGAVSEAENAFNVGKEIIETGSGPAVAPVANEPIYKSNAAEFAHLCNY